MRKKKRIRKRGVDKVTTIALDTIEFRVRSNNESRKKSIEEFTNSIKNRYSNTTRMRPKNKTEQKILDMFERK